MSEEKDHRSKKEIAADITLKEAEAALKAAEAVKTQAEARKAEYHAHEAELKYHEVRLKFDRQQAEDEMNHLYRFSGEVSKSSVERCLKKLTEWSRLKPKCDIEIGFCYIGTVLNGIILHNTALQPSDGNEYLIRKGLMGTNKTVEEGKTILKWFVP